MDSQRDMGTFFCGSEISGDEILISHLALKEKERKKNILNLNLIQLFRKATNFMQERKTRWKLRETLAESEIAINMLVSEIKTKLLQELE